MTRHRMTSNGVVPFTIEEERERDIEEVFFKEENIKKKQEGAIKKKLEDIDFKSIRLIREYLSIQPGVPQALKDNEAEAVAERAKLQK